MLSINKEVEVRGVMTLSQPNVLHFISVSATVVLLALVVAIELNPGFVRDRRVLLTLDMLVLGFVLVLGAVTNR